MSEQATCYNCGDKIDPANTGRRDTCPKCDADTRVCYNCKFYDEQAYNECHETSADRVVEKDKGNFCDYFSLGGGKSSGGGTDDARKKLDDLFK